MGAGGLGGDARRAAAADAVARGWALIPLRPMRKTPAGRKWEQGATRDLGRIESWLDRRHPCNIGIAAGPSKLVVVDLDLKSDQTPPPAWSGARSGLDVFARRAHAAGADPRPITYTVRTPSGGIHLYFQAPDGQRLTNSAGKLGWCVDVRASGGYVVGAGSETADGHYTVIDNSDVAPLPGWLADALTAPPPAARPLTSLPPIGRSEPYVQAAIASECDAVRTAPVGTRNVQLHKAARICGEFVGSGRLSEDTARAALWEAAAGHIGVDGCTEHEVTRTIASGLEYGRQRPRQLASDQSAARRRRQRGSGAR